MERIVIVGYKPLPGKERELIELMKTHWEILNNEKLVSQRKSIIMQAKEGTVIEVFGWKSKEDMERAHSNASVQRMWKEYAKVCEYVPISEIEETRHLFSEFMPLD